VPRDLQLFWKRLRKFYPARYLACGEYGERLGRPHYHAIVFGVRFEDLQPWRKSSAGFQLYRSRILELLWPHGSCEVGDVTFESAAYVARYAMKKQKGRGATKLREIVDVTTGEIFTREHEFLRMSLKPGIAAEWYEKFASDVYPDGVVVSRGGVVRKAPKFYDRRFKVENPDEYERLVARRLEAADKHFDDNSPARLRVREIVDAAKLALKQRSL